MGKPALHTRPNGNNAAVLSNVALLYYSEGLTQGEIAKLMKVSRAMLVNMLRNSRELGTVDIRIDGHHLSASRMARGPREKFGLEYIYASQTESDQSLSSSETLAQLRRVASSAALGIISPGDHLGVAWGETIMAVADAMPKAPVEIVKVWQLIASTISERKPASEN